MSYLHSPHIIFSGDFQADVSTVNNDVRHYDNANFKPNFQEFGQGGTNGWWNPNGGAAFRFVNCAVQAGERLDGSVLSSPADDPVIGQLVGGPDNKSAGKMVDLDPQMQMTSELIAVEIRLFTPDNDLLLQGTLAPVGFRDLGRRQTKGTSVNGQPMGGLWTSVLTDLQWGDKANDSPVLRELKQAACDDTLAVNLAGYGFYYSHADDGRFSMGRMLGSIGPWREGEPKRFAPARRLYSDFWYGSNTTPLFTYSNFLVTKDNQRLTLDLGNCIPINDTLGTIDKEFSKFKIVVAKSKIVDRVPTTTRKSINSTQYESIGEFQIVDGKNWLLKTGGIVSMPIPMAARNLCEDHQVLLLWLTQGREVVVAQESENGVMAKADQTVQRLHPGQTKSVDFYAYQWGKPLANTKFNLHPIIVDPGAPPQPDMPNTPTPATGTPADAFSYPSTLTTDGDGKHAIEISGSDPKTPRGYIDGQIYVIAFSLADPGETLVGYSMDWINVLLFDHYEVPDTPTWKDVAPIWTQFGNLYPVMSKHIVNMNDRSAILRRKDLLLYAFSLPETDTMYMPVTRDMSDNKRATLVKWLKNPAVDDAFTQPELREMANTVSTSRQPREAAGLIETEKNRALKQLMRSKGGAMDTVSEPGFSPADIEFDD